MAKMEAWTRSRGHRRLGAAALIALFLSTCTAPRWTEREPAPGSAPAAQREIVIDEGPVRLEALDEGHWRLVVVQPPYAPASLTLSMDDLWPVSGDRVPFQRAAFFDEQAPPTSPPEWARQIWKDYLARYGPYLLPPADQVASSRLRLALQLSLQYLPEGLVDAAREMLTDPAFYAGLGFGLYLAAWLAPEPVFSKGTAIILNGHYGPHPEAYHSAVYEQLLGALGNCAEPRTCRPRLLAALRGLATDICTPGSLLNRLITRQ